MTPKEKAPQTAVEWFMEQIGEKQPNGLYVIDTLEDVENVFTKAKEMEKQQIMDAVEWGNRKGYDEHTLTCILDEDEDYYNETYKKPLQ
jgi:hypothetical protein